MPSSQLISVGAILLVALIAMTADARYTFPSQPVTTTYGMTAPLRYEGVSSSTSFANLTLEAIFIAGTQLRIRIYPTDNKAVDGTVLPAPYVVPDLVFPGSNRTAESYTAATTTRYGFSIENNHTIVVRDTEQNDKIVYSIYNFTFDAQIVSFTTMGEQTAPFLFGYGEHDYNYFINQDANVTLSLWNTDNGTPWKKPMYGVHPVVFTADPVGQPWPMFSGMLWLNSHAQNLQIVNHVEQTFLALGGIIDLFVFVGNSSMDVTSQYHNVIGPAAVPPFWALGIHQCRWGYNNLSDVEAVVRGYEEAHLPLDVMWNDIDYMNQFRVFTTDPVRYPQAALQAFITTLHDKGMKYIQITDPGVATAYDYETYTSGIAENVFVTEADGVTPLVNVVWPGWTVFPDFSLPHANEWWAEQIRAYRKNVTVDGMWLDMNELGTFCAGQCRVAPGTPWSADWHTINWNTFTDDICMPNNCTVADSPLNYPPINPLNNGYALYNKTLDMTGKLSIGAYYNTKAFYGLLEVKATYEALWEQTGERPFILTRASYVGSGRYTAHWTGDNNAVWTPKEGGISDSIQGVLGANLWGIFTVGADIGGFGGTSNEELVVRWYQLGVFYTFTRNHHDLNGPGQEPYVFSLPAQRAIGAALTMRYRYAAYLFTALARASLLGGPVLRHLSLEFPMDTNCYTESTNFMFGDSILVAPVVQQGVSTVDVYLPQAMWYNATSLSLTTFNGMESISCPVHAFVGDSYSDIPIFIRGGSILPIYDTMGSNLNTTKKLGAGLIVFMANTTSMENGNATTYKATGAAWMAPDTVEIKDSSSVTKFDITALGVRAQGSIVSTFNGEVVPAYDFELPRRVPFTVVFPTCDPAFDNASDFGSLQVTVDGSVLEELNATFTCTSFTFMMRQYQSGISSYSLEWTFTNLAPPTTVAPIPAGSGHDGLSGRDKHIIIGACIGGATVILIGVVLLRWVRRSKSPDEMVPLQEGEGV